MLWKNWVMCYVKTKNNYNGKAWHIIYFKSGKIIKSLFNKIMPNQCMAKYLCKYCSRIDNLIYHSRKPPTIILNYMCTMAYDDSITAKRPLDCFRVEVFNGKISYIMIWFFSIYAVTLHLWQNCILCRHFTKSEKLCTYFQYPN